MAASRYRGDYDDGTGERGPPSAALRAQTTADRVSPMTFSVVIAAYNAADTLEEAIRSVLVQTRQDFEVIVVDDGSSDATATIAEGFSSDGRVQVYSQENAGPSAARNRGIAAAKGKYVSMLDSDDLWLPDYLEGMGGALDRDPHAGFAYTDAWVLEEVSGRFLKETTATLRNHPPALISNEQFIAALLGHNFVHNSVTVRRSVLEQVGGYKTDLSHGEDYELWLRIVISGFGAVRVAEPLAIYRFREGSLAHDQAAMERGVRTVYETVLERHPVSPHVRALAVARLEEMDQHTRRGVSARHRIRSRLDEATRGARARWRLQSSPPPRVAEVFPWLGLGPHGSPENFR
jgi:cellulose synthase/poly-beta-1,6-N-acetylglucosamine synthase-like glycosyltransferase